MSDLISPQSSREKLLVIQPLVGIGDMIWHKPWIDYLCTQNHVILRTGRIVGLVGRRLGRTSGWLMFGGGDLCLNCNIELLA